MRARAPLIAIARSASRCRLLPQTVTEQPRTSTAESYHHLAERYSTISFGSLNIDDKYLAQTSAMALPPRMETASPPSLSDVAHEPLPATDPTSTPPPSREERIESKHNIEGETSRRQRNKTSSKDARRNSESWLDMGANALLRDVHHTQRESTPGASPHRKRQRINGDR